MCVGVCVYVHMSTKSHVYRYMWRPEDNTGIFSQELCSSFSHLHVSLCVAVSHWPGAH